MAPPSPVIIGAGPAGIRAAERLVLAGLRPILIDEAERGGGQIYRQQPPGFTRPARERYGFEASRAVAVHAALAALGDRIDYRTDSTVWNIEPHRLWTYDRAHTRRVDFSHLIIATGATDRMVPVPGWTLPGVFSLGGSQVSLKAQAAGIGRHVLFAGTGPLLYLVAYQYAKAGIDVRAVIDTGRTFDRIAAAPFMAARPMVLAKGLYYMAQLMARGVPLHAGVTDIAIHGIDHPQSVSWRRRGRTYERDCDAVAIGFGLRSETQLADLAECRFVFDSQEQAWLPEQDEAGRSSVPGIYLAGDGAGIYGADAAEAAGARAAEALLVDIGKETATHQRGWTERLFRRGLNRAFSPPRDWAARLSDGTIVCRCEEITADELRRSIDADGIIEVNRLKALTRAGMGRCQGRMCGAACQAILATRTGQPIEAVGRLRAQAPIKPIPMGALMYQDDSQHG